MGVETSGSRLPQGALRAQDERLRRLRWRARRGLLENDLLIARFLDREGDSLSPSEADALALLLELSEPELLGLLLGDDAPSAGLDLAPVRAILQRLRATPSVAPLSPTLSRFTGG